MVVELERRLGTPARRVHRADVGGWEGGGETLLIWTLPSGFGSAYVDDAGRVVRVEVSETETP